ncbi:hypothetical protein MTO96_036893 [Rhipicephalus appendiculatus]
MAVGFLLASLSLLALIHGDSIVLLGAASVLFGLTGGSIMILFSVLIVEYFGLKKLPMAIGIHCLVNGLSALPRPLIIGYYRDRGSSYAGMYLMLAAVSLTTSLLWAIECFMKWRAEKVTRESFDIAVRARNGRSGKKSGCRSEIDSSEFDEDQALPSSVDFAE